jgi:hypothetical protein
MQFYIYLILGLLLLILSGFYTYQKEKKHKHSFKLFIITLTTGLVGGFSTYQSHIDSEKSKLDAARNAAIASKNDSLYKLQLNKNIDNSHRIIDSLNKNIQLSNGVLKKNTDISVQQNTANALLVAQVKSTSQLFKNTDSTVNNTQQTLSQIQRQITPLKDIGMSFTLSYPMHNEVANIAALVSNIQAHSDSVTTTTESKSVLLNGAARRRKTGIVQFSNLKIFKDTIDGKVLDERIEFYPDKKKVSSLEKYVHKIPQIFIRGYRHLNEDDLFLNGDQKDLIIQLESSLINNKSGILESVQLDMKNKLIIHHINVFFKRIRFDNSIFSIQDFRKLFLVIYKEDDPGEIGNLELLYGDSYANVKKIEEADIYDRHSAFHDALVLYFK